MYMIVFPRTRKLRIRRVAAALWQPSASSTQIKRDSQEVRLIVNWGKLRGKKAAE